MGNIVKNQRQANRKACSVFVESKKGSPFDGSWTVDLSEGGAGFVSSRYIPVNTKMAIQLELNPDESPVVAVGVVRWVTSIPGTDKFRIGLKFEQILTGSKSRIRQYKSYSK